MDFLRRFWPWGVKNTGEEQPPVADTSPVSPASNDLPNPQQDGSTPVQTSVEANPPTAPSPSPLNTPDSDKISANITQNPEPVANFPTPANSPSAEGNEQRDNGIDSSSSTQTGQPNISEPPLKTLEQTETILKNLPKDSLVGPYVQTETVEGTKIDVAETGLTEGITIGSVTQNLNVKPDGDHIIHVEAGSAEKKSEGVTIGNLSETVISDGMTRTSVGGNPAKELADKIFEKVRNDPRSVSQVIPPVAELNEQPRLSQPSMDQQITDISESHQGAVIGQMITRDAQLGGAVVAVETGNENRTGIHIKGDVTSTGPTDINIIQNAGTIGKTVGLDIQGSYYTHQDVNINIGSAGNIVDSEFSSDNDSE